MHLVSVCSSCGGDGRCSKREFSEQAWTVLVIWGEIEESVVEQSICDSCYEEFRDILIDRHAEIESSLKNPKPAPRPVQYAKLPIKKSAPVAAPTPIKTATAATTNKKVANTKKPAPAAKKSAAAAKKPAAAAKKAVKPAKKTRKAS
jgi:hypothetical protein